MKLTLITITLALGLFTYAINELSLVGEFRICLREKVSLIVF
jgi:hypothetical protein